MQANHIRARHWGKSVPPFPYAACPHTPSPRRRHRHPFLVEMGEHLAVSADSALRTAGAIAAVLAVWLFLLVTHRLGVLLLVASQGGAL